MKGPIKELMTDPVTRKYGNVGFENFEWLWLKYTGKTWEPFTEQIRDSDVRLMKAGLKEWKKTVGKRSTWLGRNFKLPKVLVRNIRGGNQFVERITKALGDNQKQMKVSAKHVAAMTDGMYEMFTEGGWADSKIHYKRFKQLEAELEAAYTPDMQLKALNNLQRELNNKDGGLYIGGKIMDRFEKILTMEIPESELTTVERSIARNWAVLRADSVKGLLHGALAAKKVIMNIHALDAREPLLKAHDKIVSQIERLLVMRDINSKRLVGKFEKDVDGNYVDLDPNSTIYIPKDKNAFRIYNPIKKTYENYIKTDQKTGEEVAAIKKYSPKYVIELSNMLENLTAYAKSNDKVLWENMNPEQVLQEIVTNLSEERVINRLKEAGTGDAYWSKDPAHYLTKYVHDVASFNTRTRINLAYSEATASILDNIRRTNAGKDSGEVSEYSKYLISLISDIKDSAVMQGGHKTVLDEAVRLINGFEYISKLGWSVKGGLKNRTQGLFNWVKYGTRGYVLSNRFKNGQDRDYDVASEKDLTNLAMLERAKKRFGLLIEDKAAAASLAIATGGSLDVVMIPKGYDVHPELGVLVRADKKSMIKRAADATAWVAEKGWATKPMLWAENKNRLNTFDMAFAHAFMAEKLRYEHHERKLVESSKGKTPSKAQVYDRIEHLAGNQAFEMVRFLHYDYDNWAKARILQTPIGRVVGQYQHFKFAFFDMQYSMIKDGLRDLKAFKFVEKNPYDPKGGMMVSRNLSTMMRLGALYTIIPGMVALLTDHDVGGVMSAFGLVPFEEDRKTKGDKSSSTGLIENPVIEEAAKLLDFLGNSKDGDLNEQLRHYNAYYGKNPITGNLGPFISDLLTAAELTDFLNLTGEEYEEARNLNMDTSNPDWWYNVARIFNIQASRTIWHTFPSILQGDYHKAFRIETGTYQPKWITKWRKKQVKKIAKTIYGGNILPEVNIERKKKGKVQSQEAQRMEAERIRKRALASLRGY